MFHIRESQSNPHSPLHALFFFVFPSPPPHLFLQLIPEKRTLIAHPRKLLFSILRSDLVLVHGVPLLVNPTVRPLEHHSTDKRKRRKNKSNTEPRRIPLILLGIQKHVRPENASTVSQANIQRNSHRPLRIPRQVRTNPGGTRGVGGVLPDADEHDADVAGGDLVLDVAG